MGADESLYSLARIFAAQPSVLCCAVGAVGALDVRKINHVWREKTRRGGGSGYEYRF